MPVPGRRGEAEQIATLGEIAHVNAIFDGVACVGLLEKGLPYGAYQAHLPSLRKRQMGVQGDVRIGRVWGYGHRFPDSAGIYEGARACPKGSTPRRVFHQHVERPLRQLGGHRARLAIAPAEGIGGRTERGYGGGLTGIARGFGKGLQLHPKNWDGGNRRAQLGRTPVPIFDGDGVGALAHFVKNRPRSVVAPSVCIRRRAAAGVDGDRARFLPYTSGRHRTGGLHWRRGKIYLYGVAFDAGGALDRCFAFQNILAGLLNLQGVPFAQDGSRHVPPCF